VWEKCFAVEEPCGCGASFREREFWEGVVEEAYGDCGEIDLSEILCARRGIDRVRYFPQPAFPEGAAYSVTARFTVADPSDGIRHARRSPGRRSPSSL
jgi:hypothetical protein